jgi:NAD(P)-dependent dehydrogenase (short-subunit alcohol dehydrogenase family)
MALFTGKVVLVTGVGRVGQIGHAVARACGQAGAKLILVDRVAQQVADRAADLGREGMDARAAAGDLTTPDAAREAVALATREFGGLDAVINVAGGLVSYGPALGITPEKFDLEFAINVKTTFFTCQAAIPALIARGGGAIVNFSSIATVQPASEMAAYTAAKGAVAGLTRALAHEFRDRHVRVNAVAPVAVRTGDNVAQMGGSAAFLELDQLVRTVLFLASDDARAVTGEVVALTGA